MRVLLLGDAICLTTGFAQVLRRLACRFRHEGCDVWQIAGLDTPPRCDASRYTALGVTPRFPQHDEVGMGVFPDVYEECNPDLIVMVCDPGMAYTWQERHLNACPTPHLLYAPVEGGPMHPSYALPFGRAHAAYTVTGWGAATLEREHGITVPWVYHGVDTSVFKPLDPKRRAAVRAALGWGDDFVTVYVARNNGRKGHDRLLKALTYLPASYRLYLHCAPWDQFRLGGWDLEWMAQTMGVADRVQFSDQLRAENGVAATTLAERLAAADLYVSPSSCEGFGLPLVEAMACCLPLIVPDDGGNQMEVTDGALFASIRPVDWQTHFAGAQLAAVSPQHLAQAIAAARNQPEAAARAGRAAFRRAQSGIFSWDVMAETLVAAGTALVSTKAAAAA